MTRSLHYRACLVVALLAAMSHSFAQSEFEPKYRTRLEMPSRVDGFDQPRCVAVDSHTGEIFVCDSRNQRISIFDRHGRYGYQIPAGTKFRSPLDIAVDPEGYLYVLGWRGEARAVVKLDFDGLFLGEIPLPDSGSEGPPSEVVSLAISPAGDRLFVLDEGALGLWLIDLEGGEPQFVELGEGLTDAERQEFLLGHVDVYDETVLVSVTSFGVIRLFDLDGNAKGHVGLKGTGPCQVAFPVAAALDRDGLVLVLDKQRTLFMRWDPEGNRCLGEYSGLGSIDGTLYLPDDLALDARGRIFISQGFNGRVQIFNGGVPAAGAEVVRGP